MTDGETVWVGIFTTFLGALPALAVTYGFDKYKTNKLEVEDRQKVLNTISHELTLNLKRITDQFERYDPAFRTLEGQVNASAAAETGRKMVVPDIRLERAAMDTAMFSGKLFLLGQEALELLSEQYRRIDLVNRTSDDLRAIARTPLTKEYGPIVQGLTAIANQFMRNLEESIPVAIEVLDKSVNRH